MNISVKKRAQILQNIIVPLYVDTLLEGKFIGCPPKTIKKTDYIYSLLKEYIGKT